MVAEKSTFQGEIAVSKSRRSFLYAFKNGLSKEKAGGQAHILVSVEMYFEVSEAVDQDNYPWSTFWKLEFDTIPCQQFGLGRIIWIWRKLPR